MTAVGRHRGLGFAPGVGESIIAYTLCEQNNARTENRLLARLSSLQHENVQAGLNELGVPKPIRRRLWAIWRKDPAYELMTFGEVLTALGFELPDFG